MKLKDLRVGDEFEYAQTTPQYRMGRFLVLDTNGCYLRPAAVETSRFIFSFTTKKVVRHYEEQEVIKKGATVKSQNQMGHFVGWKFGVPVRILNTRGIPYDDSMYLINETKLYFTAMSKSGSIEIFNKSNRSYELIPYKYDHPGGTNEPRYPICESPEYTAFCNSLNEMVHLEALPTKTYKFVPIPSATLIIDGKTIELSAETTAELKKKLGV